MPDLDQLLGGDAATKGEANVEKRKPAKATPHVTEQLSHEDAIACLAFRIATASAAMDRLTFAAFRQRIEKAYAPCKISGGDVDELRFEATEGKLAPRHAKLLREFDAKGKEHLVVLVQADPKAHDWSRVFPGAAVVIVRSPAELAVSTVPASVTRVTTVEGFGPSPILASWKELQRFEGKVELDIQLLDNIPPAPPPPTAAAVKHAEATLAAAGMR